VYVWVLKEREEEELRPEGDFAEKEETNERVKKERVCVGAVFCLCVKYERTKGGKPFPSPKAKE